MNGNNQNDDDLKRRAWWRPRLEDMKMPDEYGYTTISEFHNLIKQDDPLYKEGFKAEAASECIITLQDDDSLRFIKRVLEADDSTAQDKVECLRLIHAIMTRIRGGYTDDI